MKMSLIVFIAAITLCILPEAGRSAEKINVAIVDVGDKPATKEVSAFVQSAVEEEFSKSERFKLVERGRLQQVLEEVSFQQAGLTDAEAAAKLGQQLNVDKLIFLRVHRLHPKYQLSIKVIDVSTGRIQRVVNKSLGKKAGAVGAPARYAARTLIQAASQLLSTEMILIRGADFFLGDSKDAAVNPQAVSVDSFYLDPYEVSQIALAGDKLLERPDAPATQVSWKDADAYCRSIGKRLPTEAEWELAAKGKLGRSYPWGNRSPSLTRAVYGGFEIEPADVYTVLDGATPAGVHHMAGNVAEWVSDWWRQGHNYDGRPRNPTGPDSGHYKVVRGGSWEDNAIDVASTSRSFHTPERGSPTIGFRCARDLDRP
jgi:hypothetical protein